MVLQGGRDNDLRAVLSVAEDVTLNLLVGLHHLLADTHCLILHHASALDPQLQEGIVVSVLTMPATALQL